MELIVILGFGVSLFLYLAIGWYFKNSTKSLGDMLPLVFGKQAKVNSSSEFSASTAATSISLATVVMFFFEQIENLGSWLFWCAGTTAIGIYLVQRLSPKIWKKMDSYKFRPSLHEFLGTEYDSQKLAIIGSIVTILGYLGTFGLELYIGSVFFSGLLPSVPQWLVVVIISIVGFTYIALGGFRVVIITDKIQMKFIWLMIIILLSFSIFRMSSFGMSDALNNIPNTVFLPNFIPYPFLLGILVINFAMFLVSMSIWQRISASQNPETATVGLWKGTLQTVSSWSLLIIAASLTFFFVNPIEGENLLLTFLNYLGDSQGVVGLIIVFVVVLGLFGSQLSTASTVLVATAHTLYEDIVSKIRKSSLEERLSNRQELNLSRVILTISAILAIIIMSILSSLGFDILSLAFIVYGGQLSLFAPILLSLYLERNDLKIISNYALTAVVLGLLFGWSSAALGKICSAQNLILLSPVISLVVSSLVMVIGRIISKNN